MVGHALAYSNSESARASPLLQSPESHISRPNNSLLLGQPRRDCMDRLGRCSTPAGVRPDGEPFPQTILNYSLPMDRWCSRHLRRIGTCRYSATSSGVYSFSSATYAIFFTALLSIIGGATPGAGNTFGSSLKSAQQQLQFQPKISDSGNNNSHFHYLVNIDA